MSVDSYLKIESVDGESITKGFEKNIEVIAWHLAGSQAGTFKGKTSGGTAGKVDIDKLHISKQVDVSSPVLFQGLVEGKHYTKAKLVCRKAAQGSPVNFLEVTLEPVMISKIVLGGVVGQE